MEHDESIEIEGSTEKEAIERACDALNARLENLAYEVLPSEGGAKRGLMSFMRGPKKGVRIRAWRKDHRGEATLTPAGEFAKQALAGMIKYLSEQYKIDVLEQAESIDLIVQGDEGGLIIGKNGNTLDSLQFLVRKMVGKQFTDCEKQITVNTEGYRERKQEQLVSLAKQLAKKVRSSGRREVLRPMSNNDRRIVHMALKEESGVVSRSQGEGRDRCIVIHPERGDREDHQSNGEQHSGEHRAVESRPAENRGRQTSSENKPSRAGDLESRTRDLENRINALDDDDNAGEITKAN